MHDALQLPEKRRREANNKDPNTTKKENEEEDGKDDKIDVSVDPSAVDLEEGLLIKRK